MKKLIVVLFLAVSCSYADVPNEVTYQGRLREYGQPVNGTRTMDFKIYNSASGPGLVWESGNASVDVTTGTFSYGMVPNIDWRQKDYWIETVISGKTLVPREKITSQVFALHSRTAEDIEKSSGQNIHFAIGSSTYVVINTSGIEVKSGGIKFPDSTTMTSAGAGASVSVSNNADAVITGDADSNGSGDVKIKIGSTERLTVPNTGEVKSLLSGSTYYMVPRGGIIMWSGTIATIPPGWGLCDGKWYDPNDLTVGQAGQASSDPIHYIQTPDLTDRFILSVANSSENPGSTGGAHSLTLEIANLPSHIHTGTTGNQSADHSHSGTSDGGGSHSHSGSALSNGAHTHTLTRWSGSSAAAYQVMNDWRDTGGAYQQNTTDSAGDHTHTLSIGGVGTHTHIFTTGGVSAQHTHSFTTNATGSGSAIDIHPKYYKLAFITKL